MGSLEQGPLNSRMELGLEDNVVNDVGLGRDLADDIDHLLELLIDLLDAAHGIDHLVHDVQHVSWHPAAARGRFAHPVPIGG